MKIVFLDRLPSKVEAQEILRELVIKGKVCWSKHARERMVKRKINAKQVLTCLEKGIVRDEPFLANKSDSDGGYDLTVERFAAGDRLRVGVCLRFDQTVKVVTVIKIK